MQMPANIKNCTVLLLSLWLALFSVEAHAQLNSADVLDSVLIRYQTASSAWAGVIVAAATWLFWTLVVISMVWTFGMLALRKADIAEFFAELFRFTMFTGFFWWLLTNGPNFASSIYASLRQLGGNATGLGGSLSPSGVVDVGFQIFDRVVDASSVWSPVNSACGLIIAGIILVILALVGVNMLLLLISGWVLSYAGVFFLGFGGSRWTSDMAINYYKTVLGIAAQLFVMVLIVGIGRTFLIDYYARMSAGITIKEMAVMLIVAIILLMLVNKLPPLIAGIITGASVGGGGIGQLGAGAALGAAGAAAAAAATGGAMIAAGATSAAGGAQAVMAAFSKANQNVAAGTDVMSSFSGGGSSVASNSTSSGSGGEGGTGSTPFAEAAGFGSGSGGGGGLSGGSDTGDGAEDSHGGEGDAQASGSGDSAGDSTGGGSGTDSADASSPGGASGASGESGGGSTDGAGQAPSGDTKGDAKGSGGEGKGGRSRLASAASALGTAGRIAADAGANLAKGTASVAKDKAASMRAAAAEKIAGTTGGKIATAIKQQNTPTFGENSLGGASPPVAEVDDINAEIAAFVAREPQRDGTSG